MTVEIPQYKIKQTVRKLDFEGLSVGGDSSFPFMSENSNRTKPLFALEIPYIIEENYPTALKKYWGESLNNFSQKIKIAQKTDCDLISLKFNITEESLLTSRHSEALPKNRKDSQDYELLRSAQYNAKYLDKILKEVAEIAESTDKPLIFRGANNKNIDKVLLPLIAQTVKKPSIIAFADDATYADIAPVVAKTNHILVLRSPIDINLAKELNILAADNGVSTDRLLIDPDMGGLGYGLDYGFSIVEKIKQVGFDGDKMLNMPIIVFAGEEAFKAKEAKSDNFDPNWGDYQTRAISWEIATAVPMVSAGANIVVLWHPDSISTIKGLI